MEKGLDFLELKKCWHCGKEFSVLYPHLYRFKITYGGKGHYHYFCSWGCLRANEQNKDKEKNDMEKMKKDGTPAKKPVRKPKAKEEIVISAAEIIKSAEANAKEIDKLIAAHDARIAAERPELNISGQIKIVTPEPDAVEIEAPEAGGMAEAVKGMKDAAEEFFGACEDMGLTLNTKIECQDNTYTGEPEKKITKPVNYDGYDVVAIRHPELGEFYFDKKYNSIDWRTEEGDEIGMPPWLWKKLRDELPKIMAVLGVDPE